MADVIIKDKNGLDITYYGITKVSLNTVSGGIETFSNQTVESDLVKYVTFMSDDGMTELYKKPTISGDDCVDIIALGLLDLPMKNSTEQYNYTFSGWSTVSGDLANDSALLNITQDKILYAAYNAEEILYTVSFYDDDGTLLKTIDVPYGTNAYYMPNKTGYEFTGWTVDVTNVTTNIKTYAKWEQTYKLENQSWEFISECSANGLASQYWKLGDSKTFKYNSTTTLTAVIVGFDHDDLADGSGRAGITFMVIPYWYYSGGRNHGNYSSNWSESDIADCELNLENTYYGPRFPNDLSTVVKQVKKLSGSTGAYKSGYFNVGTNDYFWMPSIVELVGDTTYGGVQFSDGAQYEYLKENNIYDLNKNTVYTRSSYLNGSAAGGAMYICYNQNVGGVSYYSCGTNVRYFNFGFCI